MRSMQEILKTPYVNRKVPRDSAKGHILPQDECRHLNPGPGSHKKMRLVSHTSSIGKDSHSIRVLLHDGLLTLHDLVHLRWLRITFCSMFYLVGPRLPTGSDNLLTKGYNKDMVGSFFTSLPPDPLRVTREANHCFFCFFFGSLHSSCTALSGWEKTYSVITGALLGYDRTVYPRKTIKAAHLRLLYALPSAKLTWNSNRSITKTAVLQISFGECLRSGPRRA